MHLAITNSVGRGAINKPADVKLIQILLNFVAAKRSPHDQLAEDGKCGARTISAILGFQRNIIRMRQPDGRIDPNGKTFRELTLLHPPRVQQTIRLYLDRIISWATLLGLISNDPVKATSSKSDQIAQFKVSYKGDLPAKAHLVSEYSKNVIRLALREAGMSSAVITSTLRTPEQQAEIMYQNAAINLRNQYKLYGSVGDRVLKVYDDNKAQPKSSVVAAMAKKIKDELDLGHRTSQHCVTESAYKALNIIDIGVNSTKAACGQTFNQDKFTKALEDLVKEGYIDKLIDETKKSNQCWHVEITPNRKAI